MDDQGDREIVGVIRCLKNERLSSSREGGGAHIIATGFGWSSLYIYNSHPAEPGMITAITTRA